MDLSGGVDWLIATAPIGVGGEIGAGQLLVASLTGSYHPFVRRTTRRLDPFAMVAVTGLASSPFSAKGMSVGGGVIYWPLRLLGLRIDGFRFWPVSTEYSVNPEEFSPHYWALRAGVAFRFR